MKQFAKLAGVMFVVAACGGGESAPPAEAPEAAAAPEAPAGPAITGATHDVNMVLEGTNYLFVPSALTVKAGDAVTFHNVSGGPHNVQFWADSIPAGAADALSAGMADQMSPLASPLLVDTQGPGSMYTVIFGNVPAGDYKFYCLPHLANKMHGVVTVTQ